MSVIVTRPVSTVRSTVNLRETDYDAFSRVRISSPITEFDAKFENDDNPRLFHTLTTGTASATYLPNESSFQLSVGTASGDKVVRETERYMEYQPGKSLLIIMTGVLGAPKAGVVSRAGYFDNGDGYYFAQTETGPVIVQRSSITGSPVETTVAQANWNIDKLDGNGLSGITLDLSKAQIFVFDLQWLGVGRVRCCVDIGGNIIPVHEFLHANISTSVYISSASLPCRYELENISATGSSTTSKQVCTTVISEGGYDPLGEVFTADSGTTGVVAAAGSYVPVISFQPKTTLNSKTVRGYAQVFSFDFLNTSANEAIIKLVYNPSLTGAAFASAGADSIMNYDTTASAITGGINALTNYVPAGGFLSSTSELISAPEMRAYANPDSTNQPIFSLMAQGIGGSATIFASATWKEVR